MSKLLCNVLKISGGQMRQMPPWLRACCEIPFNKQTTQVNGNDITITASTMNILTWLRKEFKNNKLFESCTMFSCGCEISAHNFLTHPALFPFWSHPRLLSNTRRCSCSGQSERSLFEAIKWGKIILKSCSLPCLTCKQDQRGIFQPRDYLSQNSETEWMMKVCLDCHASVLQTSLKAVLN